MYKGWILSILLATEEILWGLSNFINCSDKQIAVQVKKITFASPLCWYYTSEWSCIDLLIIQFPFWGVIRFGLRQQWHCKLPNEWPRRKDTANCIAGMSKWPYEAFGGSRGHSVPGKKCIAWAVNRYLPFKKFLHILMNCISVIIQKSDLSANYQNLKNLSQSKSVKFLSYK